ncbi:exported hypothetical protein [Gammaproteobacteria bacterium]
MKTFWAVSAAILITFSLSTSADNGDAIAQAQVTAKSWLTLTDGAKYGQSWDDAASFFKNAITKADWEKAIKGVRSPLSPLGAMKARKVKSATFARTLPGAPDGEYVVIQFESQFENKSTAIETVTPMHDKDGAWRVSGYFIK